LICHHDALAPRSNVRHRLTGSKQVLTSGAAGQARAGVFI
jgi:hypothetical protein